MDTKAFHPVETACAVTLRSLLSFAWGIRAAEHLKE